MKPKVFSLFITKLNFERLVEAYTRSADPRVFSHQSDGSLLTDGLELVEFRILFGLSPHHLESTISMSLVPRNLSLRTLSVFLNTSEDGSDMSDSFKYFLDEGLAGIALHEFPVNTGLSVSMPKDDIRALLDLTICFDNEQIEEVGQQLIEELKNE